MRIYIRTYIKKVYVVCLYIFVCVYIIIYMCRIRIKWCRLAMEWEPIALTRPLCLSDPALPDAQC